MLLAEIESEELKDELITLQGRCRATNAGWLCERCGYDCIYRAKPYKASEAEKNIFKKRSLKNE